MWFYINKSASLIFSGKLGGNTQVAMATCCPSYSELMVSWLHLPYFSTCFLIMLQLYPRSFSSCKEGENAEETVCVHPVHFSLGQCRQTFLTTLEFTACKNPVTACYISHLYKPHFLKTFYFGFQMQISLDFSPHQYFCLPW